MKVYNFCLRMVFNGETARDLAQETFARIYDRMESFRGDSKVST